MLEVDCHLTRDKQVVVAHDPSLLRITGHDVFIKDMNYHELPLLKTGGISIDFEPGTCRLIYFMLGHVYIFTLAGKLFNGADDINLRKIPLLEDVFKAFPDVAVNIDVKQGGDELIHEISRLITEYKREKLTIWGSFKEDASLMCHKKACTLTHKLFYFFFTNGIIFDAEPGSLQIFFVNRRSQTLLVFLYGLTPIYPAY